MSRIVESKREKRVTSKGGGGVSVQQVYTSACLQSGLSYIGLPLLWSQDVNPQKNCPSSCLLHDVASRSSFCPLIASTPPVAEAIHGQ
jgi:hypothetical protein